MAEWPFEIAPGLAAHLSRYTPVKPIRSNGLARIHLAEEGSAGRLVAIKLLQEDSSVSADLYGRHKQHLIRSGITLGRLRHPNIVRTHDFGASPDGAFIVMEYLDGGSLEQKLASFGMLDGVDLAAIARGVASALDYAHKAGIVHCDIRPRRIVLDSDGQSRLTGFSTARSPGATSMSGSVSLPGSLVYAAPELLEGSFGPATDQFSLAAVIYRALTGRHPFRSMEVVTLIRQILTETPEPPSRVRTGLPKAVDAVMGRALARNADDRFRDCSQFVDAFEDAFGIGGRGFWSRVNVDWVWKCMPEGWGR